MPLLDVSHWPLIIAASFLVGIFAVVVGGGMFFSMPFMQWMFPEAALGVLVGNLKVGSFFRSIGSTISTPKLVEFRQNLRISAFLLLGTVIGSSLIANLSQKWLLPAVIVAVVMALAAPQYASRITPRLFNAASFLTGLYAGVLGAGIGIILIALLRLKYTLSTEIAHVKIQARFVEFLTVTVAVATHFLHGNLVGTIWIPWSIGALAGGYAGGILLDKMGKLSGRAQQAILYAAFAIAILVAAVKFFE